LDRFRRILLGKDSVVVGCSHSCPEKDEDWDPPSLLRVVFAVKTYQIPRKIGEEMLLLVTSNFSTKATAI